jgi:hypothetical protein
MGVRARGESTDWRQIPRRLAQVAPEHSGAFELGLMMVVSHEEHVAQFWSRQTGTVHPRLVRGNP